MTHELKCYPEFFGPVVSGEKRFEIRREDRNFSVGDKLRLREWKQSLPYYTGNEIIVRVDYILTKADFPAIPEGYVILSIS